MQPPLRAMSASPPKKKAHNRRRMIYFYFILFEHTESNEGCLCPVSRVLGWCRGPRGSDLAPFQECCRSLLARIYRGQGSTRYHSLQLREQQRVRSGCPCFWCRAAMPLVLTGLQYRLPQLHRYWFSHQYKPLFRSDGTHSAEGSLVNEFVGRGGQCQ
jgi:hypothetical protein